MQKIHRHIRHESIIISGGFPCQDASEGNPYGKGLDGHRTGGGWEQMYRIIREVRPEYVFVENVSNLLRRGWGKSLVIFPRQGITYGGGLYLLKTLVSRLRVNAFTPLLLRPLASDGKRYNCSIKTLSKRYKGGKSNITTPEILARFGVKLTPRFYEKIMGFPLGHTELPPWVTPVSPFSQK